MRRRRGQVPAARGEALLPWQVVRVSGPSMVPTLRSGDRVLVRHGAPIRAADLVLGRFRSMPRLLVLKRAVREADGAWELSSDNPAAGGDSTMHGPADVLARVVLVLPRRGLPRRPRRCGRG